MLLPTPYPFTDNVVEAVPVSLFTSAKISTTFEEFAGIVKSTEKLFVPCGLTGVVETPSTLTNKFESDDVADKFPPPTGTTVRFVTLTASDEFACNTYEPILTIFVLGTDDEFDKAAFFATVKPAPTTLIEGPSIRLSGT